MEFRKPTSPATQGIQPGADKVKCQGSGGGGVRVGEVESPAKVVMAAVRVKRRARETGRGMMKSVEDSVREGMVREGRI